MKILDILTEDIDPLEKNTLAGLLREIWNKLPDRRKLPRRLWFPPKQQLFLETEEWHRQHDEISISLRRTMIALLGFCFFCILTLAAPDFSLIARDAKIQVPFAGTEVSYQAFLVIGPLTTLALVTYLHILLGHWLYIGKHKDTLGLPYIFNIDSKMANGVAVFLFYWLPCIVLAFFYWKAIPRANEAKMLFTFNLTFFSYMVILKVRRLPDCQHCFKSNAIYFCVWLLGVCVLLAYPMGYYQRKLDLFNVNLIEKDLRGANLSSANLVYAELNGANLRKSNLIEAKLVRTDLSKANLREAMLLRADLRKADLRGANLWGASLLEANLKETYFQGANLEGANLKRANLDGADLEGANLEETIFEGANLRGAKKITTEQLCSSKSLFGAKLTTDMEKQINQRCPNILKRP